MISELATTTAPTASIWSQWQVLSGITLVSVVGVLLTVYTIRRTRFPAVKIRSIDAYADLEADKWQAYLGLQVYFFGADVHKPEVSLRLKVDNVDFRLQFVVYNGDRIGVLPEVVKSGQLLRLYLEYKLMTMVNLNEGKQLSELPVERFSICIASNDGEITVKEIPMAKFRCQWKGFLFLGQACISGKLKHDSSAHPNAAESGSSIRWKC